MSVIADLMDLAPSLFVLVALAIAFAAIYPALRTAPNIKLVASDPPQLFITHKGRPTFLINIHNGSRHELPSDAQCHPLSATAPEQNPFVFFSLPADHDLGQHSHRYATQDFLTSTLRVIDPQSNESFTMPSPQRVDGTFTGIHRLTDGSVSLDKKLFVAVGHRREDPQRLELQLRSLILFTREGQTQIIDIGKNDRYFFDRRSRVIVALATTGTSAESNITSTIKLIDHGNAVRDIKLPGVFIAASPDLRRAATLTIRAHDDGQGGTRTSAINIIDLDTGAIISTITSAAASMIENIAATFEESRAKLEKMKPCETAMDFHQMAGRRFVIDPALTKIHWLDWKSKSNVPAVQLVAIDLHNGSQEAILGVDKIPQPRFQSEATDRFDEAARDAIGNRSCSLLPITQHITHLTLAIFYDRYRIDPINRTIERFRLPTSHDGRGDTVVDKRTHDGRSLLAKTNIRIAMNDINRTTVVPQPDGGLFLCRPDAEPQRLGDNACNVELLNDGTIVVYDDKHAMLVGSDGNPREIFSTKKQPRENAPA